MKDEMKGTAIYLEGVSDIDYANDKDTRISVYGYYIYFLNSPIA
jgi:hypothetical protein